MSTYVSAELRRQVALRARRICEYCLISEADTYLGCQVDHILSEKHGGVTEADNLAFACTFCNQHKGTDIGSLASDGAFTRLFNPRIDTWAGHFRFEGTRILPLTAIGEATERILQFNIPERQMERHALIEVGRYPPAEAAL